MIQALLVLSLLIVTPCSWRTNASQGPKEKQGVSQEIRKVLPQETSSKSIESSKAVENRQPRTVPSTETKRLQNITSSQKSTTAKRIENTEKPVWVVQKEIHEEKSSISRPQPQDREETFSSTQQLQPSSRSFVRQPKEMPTSRKVSDKMEAFAHAIARTEGFYVKNTIPNRCHNPGDLTELAHGAVYPGQVGVLRKNHMAYVRFRDNAAGYAALYHQIEKMLNGKSKFYTQTMTLQQVGKLYAGNSRLWAKNLSYCLGVSSSTTLEDYFELPPQVKFEIKEFPLCITPKLGNQENVKPARRDY